LSESLGAIEAVWSLIRPKRRWLEKLWKLSFRCGVTRRVLSLDERRYLNALLLARWRSLRSRLVLGILAPIVKKMLNALGRFFKAPLCIVCGGDVDGEAVKGALSLMGESAYRITRSVAERISQIAQGWGNRLAQKWPEDSGFIRYLMVMSLPQNRNPFTLSLSLE